MNTLIITFWIPEESGKDGTKFLLRNEEVDSFRASKALLLPINDSFWEKRKREVPDYLKCDVLNDEVYLKLKGEMDADLILIIGLELRENFLEYLQNSYGTDKSGEKIAEREAGFELHVQAFSPETRISEVKLCEICSEPEDKENLFLSICSLASADTEEKPEQKFNLGQLGQN